MSTLDLLQGLGVFVAAAVLDYADSRNTLAVAERRAHAAARWSVTMFVLGTFGLVSLFDNMWFAVPTAAGLYVGTWIAVEPNFMEPRSSFDGSVGDGVHQDS